MTKDPVCGMMIESAKAAGRAEFDGNTYFFCSVQCQRVFQANPQRYAAPGAQPQGCGGCGCKAA